MTSETFYLKSSARQQVWLIPVICFIAGIAAFAMAGPVSEQAGDMSPAAAKLVMNILAFLLIGGGIYSVYQASRSGKIFLALSETGINLDNRWVAKWSDIESVDEEAVDIKAKGVKVGTKYKLWIRYLDQQAQQVRKFFISSDFEGYPFIKERILSQVAARTDSNS